MFPELESVAVVVEKWKEPAGKDDCILSQRSKMRRRTAANRLLRESQQGQKQPERLTANTKMKKKGRSQKHIAQENHFYDSVPCK